MQERLKLTIFTMIGGIYGLGPALIGLLYVSGSAFFAPSVIILGPAILTILPINYIMEGAAKIIYPQFIQSRGFAFIVFGINSIIWAMLFRFGGRSYTKPIEKTEIKILDVIKYALIAIVMFFAYIFLLYKFFLS